VTGVQTCALPIYCDRLSRAGRCKELALEVQSCARQANHRSQGSKRLKLCQADVVSDRLGNCELHPGNCFGSKRHWITLSVIGQGSDTDGASIAELECPSLDIVAQVRTVVEHHLG